MRIFLTGATGFIGSAIVPELLGAGHSVLGLARSQSGAQKLLAAGAEVHRGDLEGLDSLRSGAEQADGVIHAGFNHDFAKFAQNCEVDRQAIETIGEVLAGSERPLVVTAGLPLTPGRLATEDDTPPPASAAYPRVSEQTALALGARGVRVSVVRLPQVHDRSRHGLASYLIAHARQTGVSAYVGEGRNLWSAVHRLDAARLFRLVFEKGAAGTSYHAVAEEGVPLRQIAEVIGRGLGLPAVSLPAEDAEGHFGGLALFAVMDASGSSTLTRQRLAWSPAERSGFVADLEHSSQFGVSPGRPEWAEAV